MDVSAMPIELRAAVIVGTFGTVLWLEQRRPLRHSVEPKLRRVARNLSVAATSAAAVRLAEVPLILPLAALVERHRWGLLQQIPLPTWAEVLLAFVLMDYTLYAWHVLNHRIAWLWRFHVVHHIDLDLDASTALRFHFAEQVASVPWRAAQVVLIGVTPLSFSIWQTLLFVSILFHHSNVRLPLWFERTLNRFVVTPRMHGIHHSTVLAETSSNFSSGLTLWDWLHGTLRLAVPQAEIRIGVPAYQDQQEVTLGKILKLPFVRQRANWPDTGGTGPVQRSPTSAGERTELLL